MLHCCSGSRKNIEEHYDAGNAMYATFLDESMTYSCGIHKKDESLYQAQMNKLDAVIAAAGRRDLVAHLAVCLFGKQL